jgi:hypothetical protein
VCESQSTIGKWRAVNIFRVGLQAYPTDGSKEGSLSGPPHGFGLFLGGFGVQGGHWGPKTFIWASNES